MDKQTELEIVRRAYAKQILAAAGLNDLRLELAYASIRREDFLGQEPVNLSVRENVRVLQANGGDADFGTADVIYVSAGVTHPVQAWLDGLLKAGRLILPLTTDASVRTTEGGAFDYAKMARRGAVF